MFYIFYVFVENNLCICCCVLDIIRAKYLVLFFFNFNKCERLRVIIFSKRRLSTLCYKVKNLGKVAWKFWVLLSSIPTVIYCMTLRLVVWYLIGHWVPVNFVPPVYARSFCSCRLSSVVICFWYANSWIGIYHMQH